MGVKWGAQTGSRPGCSNTSSTGRSFSNATHLVTRLNRQVCESTTEFEAFAIGPTSFVNQSLHGLGVAITLHIDTSGGVIQLVEFICAEFEVCGYQVLL